jgi:hypothetical protein
MSALGHKRTFAVQNGMSALHPKADIRINANTLTDRQRSYDFTEKISSIFLSTDSSMAGYPPHATGVRISHSMVTDANA